MPESSKKEERTRGGGGGVMDWLAKCPSNIILERLSRADIQLCSKIREERHTREAKETRIRLIPWTNLEIAMESPQQCWPRWRRHAISYFFAIPYLVRKIGRIKLLASGNFLYMRCCSHILNLIVKDGLEIIKGAIENFRDSVAYWTATP